MSDLIDEKFDVIGCILSDNDRDKRTVLRSAWGAVVAAWDGVARPHRAGLRLFG